MLFISVVVLHVQMSLLDKHLFVLPVQDLCCPGLVKTQSLNHHHLSLV